MVLSSLVLLGLLGPLPYAPPRLSAQAETQARMAELTPSCSCPLAFLQSVLFDALHKGRVGKTSLFVKGLFLCYLYFREKKILKTLETVEIDSSNPPFTKILLFLELSTLLLCFGAEKYQRKLRQTFLLYGYGSVSVLKGAM